jgi:hypothetical protein
MLTCGLVLQRGVDRASVYAALWLYGSQRGIVLVRDEMRGLQVAMVAA